MRHRVAGRKLGLPSDQRMALLHGLVRSLIVYEGIETTETRAKEARAIAEKLITCAKEDSVHARRMARRILPAPKMPKSILSAHGKSQTEMRNKVKTNDALYILFNVVAPKFADKQSGYTRIVKIGCRRGDAAPMARLELAVD